MQGGKVARGGGADRLERGVPRAVRVLPQLRGEAVFAEAARAPLALARQHGGRPKLYMLRMRARAKREKTRRENSSLLHRDEGRRVRGLWGRFSGAAGGEGCGLGAFVSRLAVDIAWGGLLRVLSEDEGVGRGGRIRNLAEVAVLVVFGLLAFLLALGFSRGRRAPAPPGGLCRRAAQGGGGVLQGHGGIF